MIRSQKGQSLIQVLVAVAIMGILVAAMTSAQMLQSRENQALNDKLAALELLRSVSATMTSSDACTALFVPANVTAGSLTFDASTVDPTHPYTITLASVPGFAGSPKIITQNTLVSNISRTLFVPTGGIQVKVTGPNSADLTVLYDQTRLVRPIQNLSLHINLVSTGPTNNSTLSGCQGGDRAPLTNWTVADFNAMPLDPLSVSIPNPMQITNYYRITLQSQAYDQYLYMSLMGIWDFRSCGPLGPCALGVSITPIVAGVSNQCMYGSDFGSGGPYSNVIAGSGSCVVKVPANATIQVLLMFDGRNNVVSNFNSSTYTTGYANASTPVFTVYGLR